MLSLLMLLEWWHVLVVVVMAVAVLTAVDFIGRHCQSWMLWPAYTDVIVIVIVIVVVVIVVVVVVAVVAAACCSSSSFLWLGWYDFSSVDDVLWSLKKVPRP